MEFNTQLRSLITKFVGNRTFFPIADGLIIAYLYNLSLLSYDEFLVYHDLLKNSQIVDSNLDPRKAIISSKTSGNYLHLQAEIKKKTVISSPQHKILPQDTNVNETLFKSEFLTTPDQINDSFVCINCKGITKNGLSIGSRGCRSHTGSKIEISKNQTRLYNDPNQNSAYYPTTDPYSNNRQMWSCCNTVVNYVFNDPFHGENSKMQIGCRNSDHWGQKAGFPMPLPYTLDIIPRTFGINDTYGYSGPVNTVRISFLGYMYFIQDRILAKDYEEVILTMLKNIVSYKILNTDTYYLNRGLLFKFVQRVEKRLRKEPNYTSAYVVTDDSENINQDSYDPSFEEFRERSFFNTIVESLNNRYFEELVNKIQTREMDLDDTTKLISFTTMHVIASMEISKAQKKPITYSITKKTSGQEIENTIYFLPRVDIEVSRVDKF